MIRDVEPFVRASRFLYGDSFQSKAIEAFTRFFEKRFGVEVVYDTSTSELASSLLSAHSLANKMLDAGIISRYSRAYQLCDEPVLFRWNARYRNGDESNASGGSFSDDRLALVSTLAEATERHIWFETSDYFKQVQTSTVRQIKNQGDYISPLAFVGLTNEQRTQQPRLKISEESAYTWIKGNSLLTDSSIWLPAQVVSPHKDARKLIHLRLEPELRRSVTTGLATHPDQKEAILSGLLEVVERDAFMIMWLNQLTLPRVNIEELAESSSSLRSLLNACSRYKLTPHVVSLITDAPTHVYCIVVVDETGNDPILTFGLKAHRDPAVCAEHALLEALRMRQDARIRPLPAHSHIKNDEVQHQNRSQYWRQEDNHKKLSFIYNGPTKTLEPKDWQRDTSTKHLARLLDWCKANQYHCASVPFTSSKKNVTPWHIEMVVVPELQPLYFSEDLPHIGGDRLKSIPLMFGYESRKPFTSEPHPFV